MAPLQRMVLVGFTLSIETVCDLIDSRLPTLSSARHLIVVVELTLIGPV